MCECNNVAIVFVNTLARDCAVLHSRTAMHVCVCVHMYVTLHTTAESLSSLVVLWCTLVNHGVQLHEVVGVDVILTAPSLHHSLRHFFLGTLGTQGVPSIGVRCPVTLLR